jgi:solute carrier family 25 protein 39/40
MKRPREIARELLSTEGPSGFFRGLVPRLAKVAPSCAIVIVTYEALKWALTREVP